MRLKKLQLQGYKTFATKTEFIFDEGITAVVGPNGSGKSNIADAVRWVLGEQSYSTLRGKRTTDMIFSGSQSRARAGMAQAILTLDNSNGWLPIDYSEVEIGRRAYRSGENEYILNGQKVRLRDITDLLATSGLAQRTYTIIGQGLIDQALSLRAEERRALFEEAAGINHYKSRRAETLRRLQETQRNLQRVHDILAEIRPRLGSLKRQATRAQNYEQLTTDLHQLLRLWYGFKWEQAKSNLRLAKETAATAEESWQAVRRQLLVQQENGDDLRRRLNRQQQRLTELHDSRDDLRDQLETARREVAILHERQQALQRQISDTEAELPPLQAQRTQAEADLNEALAAMQSAQADYQQQQNALTQFNSDFQTQQAAINRWQKAEQTAEANRRRAQTLLAQSEGQLNQLRERLQEQQGEDDGDEDGELLKLEQETTRLTAVLQTTQQSISTQRDARQDAINQRQALIRDLKQLRREQHDAERQLNQQRRDLARLEAQVEMLDQMRLKEVAVSDNSQLIGTLASLITIPDDLQTAVAAALKEQLASLIFNDSASLLHFAQHSDSAQVAIALDRLRPASQPDLPANSAILGWANTLVTAEKAAQNAVNQLLGTILLVKDAASAYALAADLPPGFVVAASDGFVAHAAGWVQIGGGSNDILAQEARWRDAQQQVAAKQTAVAQAEESVQQRQTRIQEKQDAVDARQQQETQHLREEQTARQTEAQQQRDLDRVKQQQAYLTRQAEARQQTRARLTSRVDEVEATLAEQQTAVATAESELTAATTQLNALPVAEATQQRSNLQQAIHAAQTIVAGRQAVVDSRRATFNQVDGQINRLRARLDSLKEQQTAVAESDQTTHQQQLQTKLADIDAQLDPVRRSLRENRLEMGELEEKTAVLQKQTHDRETRYTQTQIAYTQRKNEIEALQERIKSDLGTVVLRYDDDQTGPTPLPIDGIEQLPQVDDLPDDIEDTIHTYRGQMNRMGAINPDAPAEYEETQERYDFMTQQIDDLNQTEAQLRDIIADLDELTSRAFAETVDKVNAVFGTTFTQLFGGGAGRLVLTDPDDLTISGVDIVAQLPGRREQELALLSGGERSLTAAALIFSLLKVSPTPFCIMDEVDAALDEANINRFRDQLRELSLNTQFIVITHNRGTVQAAQTIYGISMGTDSASQSISIKPEDYVKQPEFL